MILLRVEMLDIPGALANAAAAIASTGTDIASIRIVGRTDDDTVVDDFICELAPDVLPDSLVSAFAESTGANVLWISRCPDQWDLLTESDLVGEMASDSARARELFFSHAPGLFHCQWAAVVRQDDGTVLAANENAPELTAGQLGELEPLDELHSTELGPDWAPGWSDATVAVVPAGRDRVVLMGRAGGPTFLDTELRRLARVTALLPSAPILPTTDTLDV